MVCLFGCWLVCFTCLGEADIYFFILISLFSCLIYLTIYLSVYNYLIIYLQLFICIWLSTCLAGSTHHCLSVYNGKLRVRDKGGGVKEGSLWRMGGQGKGVATGNKEIFVYYRTC